MNSLNPLTIKRKNYILFKTVDINIDKQETGTSSSDPNGKGRIGPIKLLGNTNKNRMTSRDDHSLRPFSLSAVDIDP